MHGEKREVAVTLVTGLEVESLQEAQNILKDVVHTSFNIRKSQ